VILILNLKSLLNTGPEDNWANWSMSNKIPNLTSFSATLSLPFYFWNSHFFRGDVFYTVHYLTVCLAGYWQDVVIDGQCNYLHICRQGTQIPIIPSNFRAFFSGSHFLKFPDENWPAILIGCLNSKFSSSKISGVWGL